MLCIVFMVEFTALLGLFAIGLTGSLVTGVLVMFFSLFAGMVAFVLVYKQSEASFLRTRKSSLRKIVLSALAVLNLFLVVAILRGTLTFGGMPAPGTIAGGVVNGAGDRVLVFGKQWRISRGRRLQSVTSTEKGVLIVERKGFFPDISREGYLFGWDLKSGAEVAEIEFGHITSVGFGNGAPIPLAVAGNEDGVINVWDTRDGVLAASFSLSKRVSGVALMGGGTVVVGTANSTAADIRGGALAMWDVRSKKQIHKSSIRGTVNRMTSSSDGRLLAIATRDATTAGPMPPGFMKDVNPDATSNVVPGGVVVSIGVWEFQPNPNPRMVGNRNLRGEMIGRVNGMAFSPRGDKLVVGCESGRIFQYEFSGGRMNPVGETQHKKAIHSVAFTSDGKQIAAGTVGGKILLFDESLAEPLQSYSTGSSPVVILARTANPKELVYASKNSVRKLQIE